MRVRVRNPRRKFVAVLSFFALQAALAAGPIRAGAETGAGARRGAAAKSASSVGGHDARAARSAARPSAFSPAPPAADALAVDDVAAAPGAAATGAARGAVSMLALVPPDRLYLRPILERAAHDTGLPTDLVLAQAWAESSWRVDAVSGIGALGVLQLTPDTVDFVSKNLLHLDHDLDVLDPVANARMGTVYLKHLLEHTDGDLHQALMAYNQGLRSLYQDGPDPDAQAYADAVLALRPVFAGGA
jgi:soluble lytic murein transglycosylase-like protein